MRLKWELVTIVYVLRGTWTGCRALTDDEEYAVDTWRYASLRRVPSACPACCVGFQMLRAGSRLLGAVLPLDLHSSHRVLPKRGQVPGLDLLPWSKAEQMPPLALWLVMLWCVASSKGGVGCRHSACLLEWALHR